MYTELPPSSCCSFLVSNRPLGDGLQLLLSSRKFEVAQIWNTKMQPKCMRCRWKKFLSIIRSGERKPAYQSLKPKPPPTHITSAITSTLNRLDMLNLNLHAHLCRLIDLCHEKLCQKESGYSGFSHSSREREREREGCILLWSNTTPTDFQNIIKLHTHKPKQKHKFSMF